MNTIFDFIKKLPDVSAAKDAGVYKKSINNIGDLWVFMVNEGEKDVLIATGKGSEIFSGEKINCPECAKSYIKAPLNHENAIALRKTFAFTAPIPVLREKRSMGVGDRLGIAAHGHIRCFNDYDAYPILAQQSIRELNLTNRTYENVLDCASYAVFRDGFKRGFGADGDHLKKPEDIEYALSLGFTMITLDCSDHIRNDVNDMSFAQLKTESSLPKDIAQRYLDKTFEIEDDKIKFTEEELLRIQLIYSKAVDYTVSIWEKYLSDGSSNVDFEISIDETPTPTTPLQHFYVANELTLRGVKFATVAPRFCGEFQKGVDYIGDLVQFEKELKIHAAIARKFGYKLSIHSGSDKFSTFKLIGKYTQGKFHVKTAGTNWLEAMRAVAKVDPKLYREIHKFALSMFEQAKKFYHVTTDLSKIADVDTLNDNELVELFNQNDARQLIHITYGFILTEKNADGSFRFKDKLYKMWREGEEVYAEMLHKHIGRHLELLYSGFEK
ncbi:MAG: hypothetical protein GX220_08990 [Treponema sp.]|nr:hypothetical protein [Treponema sp.]